MDITRPVAGAPNVAACLTVDENATQRMIMGHFGAGASWNVALAVRQRRASRMRPAPRSSRGHRRACLRPECHRRQWSGQSNLKQLSIGKLRGR